MFVVTIINKHLLELLEYTTIIIRIMINKLVVINK